MMQIYGKYGKICYNIWKESVGKETSIMKKNRTIKQTIEFYVMAVAILLGVLLTVVMIISSFVSTDTILLDKIGRAHV